MTESHSKKFLASNQLYFLPVLKKMEPSAFRSTFKVENLSPTPSKSIQQIIRDKSTGSLRRDHNSSWVHLSRPSANTNLYNKYEFLPKIYSHRYKKNQIKKTSLQVISKQTDNSFLNQVCRSSESQNNKENNLNFDPNFYRQRFNKKLQKEIDNLQFTINTSYSHRNLLLAATIEEQPETERENERKPKKCKYTRLETESQEGQRNHQLEKVPPFLLRLVSSPKLSIK